MFISIHPIHRPSCIAHNVPQRVGVPALHRGREHHERGTNA